MNEPTQKSFETNTKNPDFQKQIDAITDRSLSPENIDSYADEALEDLVEVVRNVTAAYAHEPTIVHETGADQEHAAFSYFGMNADQIEATLDHVADLSEEIAALDDFIKTHANNGSNVVTPPSAMERAVIAGSGLFEEKAQIPRLKTVLLLLKHQFGIDLEDEAQICIIPGKVTSDMMRQTPYNLIDLPVLDRMIDVCDEKENKTFVFDRVRILALSLDADLVAQMSKKELDSLIAEDPTIGRGVVYHETTYVDRINDLLNDGLSRKDDVAVLTKYKMDRLLKPSRNYVDHKPEGSVTLAEAAEICNRSLTTLQVRVRRLEADPESDFGVVNWLKSSGSNPMRILSREQLDALVRVDRTPFFDHLPAGYITATDLASRLGLSFNGMDQRLTKLAKNPNFGEVQFCRRPEKSNKLERILSLNQQEMIEGDELNVVTEIPEGYVTLEEFAIEQGLPGKNTVSSRINKKKAKGIVFNFLRYREMGRKGKPLILLSPSDQVILSQ